VINISEQDSMQAEVVKFLKQPENYPDKTTKVEHKQTHISHVFLTDKYAYKIKKPVDFGFLDFTTLAKRKLFCNEEIRLNKRLSPEIYIGVEKITKTENNAESDTGFEFNGKGEVVEYAVKMKRMPESAIMTEMVKNNKVDERIIAQLARKIAEFHMDAMHNDEFQDRCGMKSVKMATDQNFSQTEKYIGKLIDNKKFNYIRNATNQFYKGKKELFLARKRNNNIIGFHGDLHTGNVFIHNNKIQVFDCIEFNDEFRCGDVVSDIAFMAMDLDYLGREDLSKYFVRKYIEYTGDHLVYTLLNFFKCYRAYVRAKVTSFMLDDPNISRSRKDELKRTAKKYYWLALEYARHFSSAKPLLMISCGLTGSGKSRWLKFASDVVGGTILRTDRIRRKLFNLTGSEKKDARYRKKYYNEESRQKVYDMIFRKTAKVLGLGGKVSIDASFIKKENRDAMKELAEKHNADFIIIYTRCSEETTKKRINARMKEKSNISDADYKNAYIYQEKVFEKPSSNEPVIRLDTDKPVFKNIKYLRKKLDTILGIQALG